MAEFLPFWDEWTTNLNIKNAEAHKMAVQLAKQTGNSITASVTEAIRRELRRTRDNSERIARIDATLARMSMAFKDAPPSTEATDFLYDDKTGLPK
jgi:antitoxin VapB